MNLFWIGIGIGILTRLTDIFDYNSLLSLSSIATLFGFRIVSVTIIIIYSQSHKETFFNVFLYMIGMTISYYGLKYILGFFFPLFESDGFPVKLFISYCMQSIVVSMGCSILYFWNKDKWYKNILYALPSSALLAEGISCLYLLITQHILLVQTIFDFIFGIGFIFYFKNNISNKILFITTLCIVTIFVFYNIYFVSMI
ncbi:hypothetical protein [Floccifex sp.]|uniref:hypothetical protein n=1 Tax=Floccifex sp. TaxID=2815810 RepID=UPI003EFD01A2